MRDCQTSQLMTPLKGLRHNGFRCSELDESMGDTATNICDHETSIMLALSAFVLERSVLILDIAHSLCQLDCLLSLATVARENNWCRPDVVDQGTVVIR